MEIKYINGQKITQPDIQKAVGKLEELQNKSRSPEYTAMMEKHGKALMRIAADAVPWEWSYSLDALVEFLRWMRDYYKLGENVWGMELKDEDPKHFKNHPTRLESIEKTLAYYDKWQGLEDEYIKVVRTGELKSHDNGDGTSTIDDLGCKYIYKYGSMKRTYKKLHKAQNKYKKLFYKMLYKYMESWWD